MKQRFVVVTRPEAENKEFVEQIKALGVSVFSYPTITIAKNSKNKKIASRLNDIASFDWVLFTSKNGVNHFITTLNELKIDSSVLFRKKIAAVGPITAVEVKKHGFKVTFIPTQYTTDDLGNEIQISQNENILLPRSDIATPRLTKILQSKGARVIDLPIYKTEYVTNSTKQLSDLLSNDQILCIAFTSPSTVKGFVKNLTGEEKEKALSTPVLSIGSVTTKEAEKQGFRTLYTADTYTIEGMLTKLKESIL